MYVRVCLGWNGWKSSSRAPGSACMPICWRASAFGTPRLACRSSAADRTSGGSFSTPKRPDSTTTTLRRSAPSGTAHTAVTSSPSPNYRRSSRTPTRLRPPPPRPVPPPTAAPPAAPSAPRPHRSRRRRRPPPRRETGERIPDLKGTVHPKMNMSWKYTHPQAIKDVDELVSSSDLEKCVSLMEVNGCRQNESLIKTSQ